MLKCAAQRLAQDIGTGGGHWRCYTSTSVCREWRTLITNANAKGKSNTRCCHAYGNAAVQAIEKCWARQFLSPIGKKGLTAFITGAIAFEKPPNNCRECTAKHTYDLTVNTKKVSLRAALWVRSWRPAGMVNLVLCDRLATNHQVQWLHEESKWSYWKLRG